MFSSLEHLTVLAGASVLDLYAGSGALGLEAASRGATRVVCVDSSRRATDVIRKNMARIRPALDTTVVLEAVTSTARAFCQQRAADTPFDVVFLDPPYDVGNDDITACLEDLSPHLTSDAVVMVERSKKTAEPAWPAPFQRLSTKVYGDTAVYSLENRR